MQIHQLGKCIVYITYDTMCFWNYTNGRVLNREAFVKHTFWNMTTVYVHMSEEQALWNSSVINAGELSLLWKQELYIISYIIYTLFRKAILLDILRAILRNTQLYNSYQ